MQKFAERQERNNIVPILANLEKEGDLLSACASTLKGSPRRLGLGRSCASLILMSRFLNRDIFADTVSLLRPGGYILIHHFMTKS